MKTLHLGIVIASIAALIVILVLLVPTPVNNTIMITPSKPYQEKENQNTIDVQKAMQLAENNIDGLTTSYACHFDSESGTYSNFPNGTSKLEAVRIGYNCNSPYVSSFIIIEDPNLTKVINVTTLEPMHTMPEH